jgi:nitrogen regulatory protein A
MMVLEQAKTNKDYARLVKRIYHTSDFEFVGIALQETFYPFVIKWRFAAGNQSERFRQIVLRKGIGIAGLVFRTGKPFYDNNLGKYNFSNKMYTPIANAESLWSAVAIPIASSLGTVNAVLLAGYRRKQPVNLETVVRLREYLHG